MINWYDKQFFDNVIAPKEALIGIQNVFTPIDKIENVTGFSFINAIPAGVKEICVLFNAEFIIYFLNSNYIKDNNIKLIYGYDSDIDKKVVVKAFAESNYNNYELLDLTEFSNTKDIGKIEDIMGQRKFDVVFSNPPWNSNLDLKILPVFFNIAKNIIFIHPSCFVIDKKFALSFYNDVRNSKYCTYINIFWGNKLFDIDNQTPVCISMWDTTKKTDKVVFIDNINNEKNICNINDVSLLGQKYFELQKYVSKNNISDKVGNFIIKKQDNKFCKIYESNNKYGLYISLITGTNNEETLSKSFGYMFNLISNKPNKKYLYDKEDVIFTRSAVNKKGKPVKMGGMADALVYWFDTELERNNFLNYIKTKFARIMLATIKSNLNLNVKDVCNIPWLDFTQSWNDAKLCKEFNISEELWQYIDKFIPDYYDDYESGF